MDIVSKSLIVINRETESIESRDIPSEFNVFANTLISYINSNSNVKEYQSTSLTTQVVSCALAIADAPDDMSIKTSNMNDIAQRLLQKELNAEQRSMNLNSNIQKGSLIQSLLYDDVQEKYYYLLAKVEHISFIDDTDFSIKAGFSEDNNKIWKTCLLDLEPIDTKIRAKVYSNTGAKYWNNEFLELVELNTDEVNTGRAYKHIDSVLKRRVKKDFPHDYTILKNTIISHFRTNAFFDYSDLMEQLTNYTPASIPSEKYRETLNLLDELPIKYNFDRQFNSQPSAIKAKIRTVYKVNEGIELKISDYIANLEQNIYSERKEDGGQYIVIKTDNIELFRTYQAPTQD